jgi:DNA polymerase-3 subunit delta'
MPWVDILEHDGPKERLRHFMAADRVPGSLLFHGPWGIGKTRTALTFARALNCETNTGDACDACASCRKALKFAHPDIRFVFPMPRARTEAEEEKVESSTLAAQAKDPLHVIQFDKNATIWIDTVRAIRRASAMTAAEGRRKVFVIRDADRMGANLAGVLLKILEEPPADTHFILTSGRAQALLPTIVSRCQALRFRPLAHRTVAKVLETERGIGAAEARLCAALAQGSLGRALLMAAEDVRALRDQALAVLAAAERGGAALHEMAGELAGQRDRDLMRRLAHALAVWHGDLLTIRYGLGKERLANVDQLAELKRQAAAIDVGEIQRRLDLFEELRLSMDRNVGYAIAAYWLMASLAEPAAARATQLTPV